MVPPRWCAAKIGIAGQSPHGGAAPPPPLHGVVGAPADEACHVLDDAEDGEAGGPTEVELLPHVVQRHLRGGRGTGVRAARGAGAPKGGEGGRATRGIGTTTWNGAKFARVAVPWRELRMDKGNGRRRRGGCWGKGGVADSGNWGGGFVS